MRDTCRYVELFQIRLVNHRLWNDVGNAKGTHGTGCDYVQVTESVKASDDVGFVNDFEFRFIVPFAIEVNVHAKGLDGFHGLFKYQLRAPDALMFRGNPRLIPHRLTG